VFINRSEAINYPPIGVAVGFGVRSQCRLSMLDNLRLREGSNHG
jgi:hypothetical protein